MFPGSFFKQEKTIMYMYNGMKDLQQQVSDRKTIFDYTIYTDLGLEHQGESNGHKSTSTSPNFNEC